MHGESDVPTDTTTPTRQAAAAAAPQRYQRAKDAGESQQVLGRTQPSKPAGGHVPCQEALQNAVKNAALAADPTANGSTVHVSRTCLMTDSQLSLQVTSAC